MAYDPTTGQVTGTRNFPTAALPPPPLDGYVIRQEFNADFTEVVAQGPLAADGSSPAGTTGQSGKFTALTAGTSAGYGSPTPKSPIAFNPKDGRLWYVYGNAPDGSSLLGSVDPAVGASSDRKEPGVGKLAYTDLQPLYQFGYTSAGGVIPGYFAPDGYGPADPTQFASPGHFFLPGGVEMYASGGNGAFQVGPEGKMSPSAPQLPVTNTDVGFAKLPVSSNSFIATNEAVSPTQYYLCTIGPKSISSAPLLPPSTTRFVGGDMALDSSGGQLAFLSTAGDVISLYTTPLKSGQEPTQVVAKIQAPQGYLVRLLAWNS